MAALDPTDPVTAAALDHAPKILRLIEDSGLQRRAVPLALSIALGHHMAQVVDPDAWKGFVADLSTAALAAAATYHQPEPA